MGHDSSQKFDSLDRYVKKKETTEDQDPADRHKEGFPRQRNSLSEHKEIKLFTIRAHVDPMSRVSCRTAT